MSAPTRFTNGVSSSKTGVFKNFPFLNPTEYTTYFNDFLIYTSGDWNITKVDGGTDGAEVLSIANKAGGFLTVTTNDADNDAQTLQLKGESFKFVSGKKAFFETRFNLVDATQSDALIGLVITDTTPLANSDGVYFLKTDGAATVDFLVNKNSTATTESAVATLSDNTNVKLGFYFNGTDLYVFVDGVQIASVATTNLPDDEDLTVTMHIQAGEAAAKTINVDYVLAAFEK